MKRLLLFTLLLTTITFAPAIAQTPVPEREYNFKMTQTQLIWVIQSLAESNRLSAKNSNELIEKLQSQFADTTLNKR